MIAGSSITVRVGSRTLLDAVSLEVGRGQLCAVIGPNGAGKSTLLHTLTGDITFCLGEVRVADRPLSAWRPAELAKIRAVLPQESSLAFPFTALEVVLLGRAPHVRMMEGAEDLAIAERCLARVGLSDCAHRSYPTLSGGERQRVQLARALAQLASDAEGRVLLLDEPTSSLDPAHQHHTLRIARELADSGVAVLAVLHDLSLAAHYADQIAVLHRGRLEAHGLPSEVLTDTRLSRVFDVPMRVVPCPWDERRLLVAVEGG